MKNKALYFPYIRLPESDWLTRMLLYWDDIASISPTMYLEEPDRLGSYMQELLQEELISQIHPAAYVWDVHSFAPAFEEMLHADSSELPSRQQSMQNRIAGSVSLIHLEKMGPVASVLTDLGLARSRDHSWFFVEKHTATDFMAYLASFLGQLDNVDAMPVTDSSESISQLVRGNFGQSDSEIDQVDETRQLLLNDLFPVPSSIIPATELRNFKDKHGAMLKQFRIEVENEIDLLLCCTSEAMLQRRRERFKTQIAETNGRIIEEMSRHGMGACCFSTLLSLGTVIPGVSQVKDIVTAVRKNFFTKPVTQTYVPFAYASYVQSDLTSD